MKIKTGKFEGHILKVLSAKSAGLDESWGKFLVVNQTISRIGVGNKTKTAAIADMRYIAETGDYDFGDFTTEDLDQ